MRRLFVAIPIPPAVRSALELSQGGISGARWVAPENFHVTLRFIGEVDGGLAADVADALSRLRFDAFDLSLSGIGHFESKGRINSVWAGVAEQPELTALQRKVETAVSTTGVGQDRRKFKPHVTLARLKDTRPADIGGFIQSRATLRTDPFTVDSIVLYESVLGNGGPTYIPEMEIMSSSPPVS